MYLNQDIEREKYLQEKNALTLKKQTLTEQIANLKQNTNLWLEPLKEWLKQAQTMEEIANANAIEPKKSAAQTICGSNLFLRNKEIEFTPKMHWAALSAAKAKIGKIPDCNILVGRAGIEPATNGLKGHCSTD
jgi:hypothetical protein